MSQANGSGNGTTPQPAANGNGNGTQPRHFAELESWYIRTGLAEDMGIPFNEPHPFRSKRDGTGTV